MCAPGVDLTPWPRRCHPLLMPLCPAWLLPVPVVSSGQPPVLPPVLGSLPACESYEKSTQQHGRRGMASCVRCSHVRALSLCAPIVGTLLQAAGPDSALARGGKRRQRRAGPRRCRCWRPSSRRTRPTCSAASPRASPPRQARAALPLSAPAASPRAHDAQLTLKPQGLPAGCWAFSTGCCRGKVSTPCRVPGFAVVFLCRAHMLHG